MTTLSAGRRGRLPKGIWGVLLCFSWFLLFDAPVLGGGKASERLSIRAVSSLDWQKEASLPKLISLIFRKLLDRPPSPSELSLAVGNCRSGSLTIRTFIINLLRTREYLQESFVPFGPVRGTQIAFQRLIGRPPTRREILETFDRSLPGAGDFLQRKFVEKWYPLILENLLQQLERGEVSRE